MALRAVTEHPKFARLKTLLRLGKGEALGYLECVWHFCGKYTPQGDIGKYPVEEIEAWCEWPGEEGALVAALVKARWIDEHPVYGLVVHDWHKHADDATKLALKRSKRGFVVGENVEPTDPEPTPCDDPEKCPDSVGTVSGLPEPEPVPVPEPDVEREGDAGARLFPKDGAAYWLPATEPVRSVGLCLCRAYDAMEQPYPSEDIVRKGARDGSAVRKVIEAVGWEEAGDLHAWAVKHGKGDTFTPILNNLAPYRRQMQKGTEQVPRRPAAGGGQESQAERKARMQKELLDRRLAEGKITRAEYDRALAGGLANVA